MLTQDQINQIAKLNGGSWVDPSTGRLYMAQYTGGTEAAPPELQGFIGTDSASKDGYFSVGTPVSHYDLQGNKGMSYNVPEPEPMFSGIGDFVKSIAPVALAAFGMNYAFPTAGGSLSSLPLDVGGGGSGLAETAAASGAAEGAPAAFNAAMDSQLANASLGLGANSAFAGTVAGIPAAAGGGGGWMSTLANTVGGADNLRLLTSLGGGLLAAGSDAPQTTRQSKMDPRLDPYVFGEQGVVPRAALLYDQRTAPNSQTMTDRAALRARAKGLLGI